MTYYKVLGVRENASTEKIRDAYVNLIKKYEGAVNPGEEIEQQILEIKLAFEILSDPVKRESYDLRHITYYTAPGEEDPREVYRREFLLRQKENKKEEAAIKDKVDKIIFHICRIAAGGMLLFSVALIVDDH
jgi:DnaJ-class molecular chaperone